MLRTKPGSMRFPRSLKRATASCPRFAPTSAWASSLALAALCLVALAALSAAPAAADEAESGLELKYMYYRDKNKVWNHTPALSFLQKLPGYFRFRWDQEFDAVSGASRRLGLRNVGRLGDGDSALDGVSGASRRETRHSEQGTLAYSREGRAASASFYFSRETDYTSYSPSLSGAHDFNDRNTTASAGYALFLDRFHPRARFAGLTGSSGKRSIQSVTLGISQVLSPLSLASVTLSPIFSRGFLGHPYTPPFSSTGALLTESLPGKRRSLALTGALVQGYHLGDALGSVHAELRHYRDSWDLVSNTLDLKVHQYLGETSWIRLRARGYRQGKAAFYRRAYAGDEAYRTADIRYSAFSSLTLGLKAGSAFPEAWSGSAWLPDRWDLSYDHAVRNTRGDLGHGQPYRNYQLFSSDEYYSQGTLMAGLGFDL